MCRQVQLLPQIETNAFASPFSDAIYSLFLVQTEGTSSEGSWSEHKNKERFFLIYNDRKLIWTSMLLHSLSTSCENITISLLIPVVVGSVRDRQVRNQWFFSFLLSFFSFSSFYALNYGDLMAIECTYLECNYVIGDLWPQISFLTTAIWQLYGALSEFVDSKRSHTDEFELKQTYQCANQFHRSSHSSATGPAHYALLKTFTFIIGWRARPAIYSRTAILCSFNSFSSQLMIDSKQWKQYLLSEQCARQMESHKHTATYTHLTCSNE